MNKLADFYLFEFGEYPPLITTIPYDTPQYAELIMKALDNHKPISSKDLDIFEHFDVVKPNASFSKFGK